VLVLTFIDQELEALRKKKPKLLKADIWQAVFEGTSKRLRPVAMTSIATIAGLFPIMLSSGTGSDVMHRIAAPMTGGMVSVLILSLVVLPVIYGSVLNIKEKITVNISKRGG